MVREESHGHNQRGTLWRAAEPLPTSVSSLRTVFMYVCNIQPCLSGSPLPGWLVSVSLSLYPHPRGPR